MEKLKGSLLFAIRCGAADFSINGSTEATARIAAAVSAEDWAALKKRAEGAKAKTEKPRYRREMNEHMDALTRMRANRDVTVLMPGNTRLAFIKKTVKKLNMATTRFQEEFNGASLDAVAALAEYAIDAEKKLAEQQKQLERQNELIERLMKEQVKLCQTMEELKRI